MKAGRSFTVLFLLGIMLVAVCRPGLAAPAGTILSAQTRVGWTLLPPDLQALEYGGVPGDWQQMNALNYGILLQGLFLPLETGVGMLRIGAEFGFSWLFTSTVQDPSIPYNIGAIQVTEDRYIDREMSMSFGGVAQIELSRYLFLKAGVGAHAVLWLYDYSYKSTSSVDSNSDSGTGISPAFMFAAGTNLPARDTTLITIAVRVDLLLRYGLMVPVSVTAGVSFPM